MLKLEGGGSSANAVTTDTSQTIDGAKTFSATITDSVASGQNAIAFTNQGARLHLGGADADNNTLRAVGNALVQFGVGSTEVVMGTCQTQVVRGLSANRLQFSNFVNDGASAVGFSFDTGNAFSTAGAKLVSFRNNGTEKLAISKDGKLQFDATDSSGSAGAATINKPSGQVAIAAGASSVTVTNSLVSTTSVVYAVIQQSDSTLTQILRVVPSSGSFVITGNANATAATKVGFVVFN